MKLLFFFIAAVSRQVSLGDNVECGVPLHPIKRRPEWGNRIVGGWEARPHSIPWQVRLFVFLGDDLKQSYKCGGSLIQMKPGNETDLILSAAHCFYDVDTGEWSPESRVRAIVGIHNDKDPHEPSRRVLEIKAMICDRQFANVAIANDIALLQTRMPIPYTDNTRPVCLPEKDEELRVGAECFVSGWGLTKENGTASNLLQIVNVIVQPDEACVYQEYRDTVFCAGHLEGGKDACVGDSGGPLFCYVDGKYVQYGIVSQGVGCAQKSKPGEYTQVSKYLKWLEDKVSHFGSFYSHVNPATRNNSVLFSIGKVAIPAKPQRLFVPGATPSVAAWKPQISTVAYPQRTRPMIANPYSPYASLAPRRPLFERPYGRSRSRFETPWGGWWSRRVTTRTPYVSRFQRIY